jgi:MCM3AP domain of GANP
VELCTHLFQSYVVVSLYTELLHAFTGRFSLMSMSMLLVELKVNINWNTDSRMESLRNAIMSVTLREMDCTVQTDLWSAAVDDVLYYVIDLIDCHNSDASQLWSK